MTKVYKRLLNIIGIEFLLFISINIFIYAEAFKSIWYLIFIILIVLIRGVASKIIKKNRILILGITLVAFLIPFIIINNMPKYTEKQARAKVGNYIENYGVVKYVVDKKMISTDSGFNTNVWIKDCYLIKVMENEITKSYLFNMFDGKIVEVSFIQN